jgi:hypothetical protein
MYDVIHMIAYDSTIYVGRKEQNMLKVCATVFQLVILQLPHFVLNQPLDSNTFLTLLYMLESGQWGNVHVHTS